MATIAENNNTTASKTSKPEADADSNVAALKEAASQKAEEVRAAADATLKSTTDAAADLAKSGSKFVEENPGVALAGAAGLGVLLGLALGHKRAA
jgi:ElaB/YqjD/DUF883 family membrane-anchored ribosome-binding protein